MNFYHVICLFILIFLSKCTADQDFVYFGCYRSFNILQKFEIGPITSKKMTPFECMSGCAGYAFAALQAGRNCYCGNLLNPNQETRAYESNCDSPCVGDVNTVCGGDNLYYSLYFGGPQVTRRYIDRWKMLPVKGFIGAPFRSPHPRAGHSIIYSSSGAIYIYAGYTFLYRYPSDNGTFITESSHLTRFNDVWKFHLDSQTWEEIHDGLQDAPTPRSSHSAVFLPPNNMIICCGFSDLGTLNDVWKFNFDTRLWTKLHDGNGFAPPKRGDHSAVLDTRFGMVIFGGGFYGDFYNDLWRFDIVHNTWEELDSDNGPKPAPRAEHAAALVPPGSATYQDWNSDGSSMVITFGRGKPLADHCYNEKVFMDVWQYHFVLGTWKILADGSAPWDWINKRWAEEAPPNRFAHSMVFLGGGLIIFGGIKETASLQDRWRFDFETRTWGPVGTYPFSPFNRSGHAAVSTPSGDLIIFGGELGFNKYFNDVWLWTVNVSELGNPSSNNGGVAGTNMGVALASIWSAIFGIVVAIYLPKKRKNIKSHSVDRQNLPDNDIFQAAARRRRREKRVDRISKFDKGDALELVEMQGTYPTDSLFDSLPDEILIRIFEYLEGYEMCRVSQVCHRFYLVANDNTYWRALCEQHWNAISRQNSTAISRSNSAGANGSETAPVQENGSYLLAEDLFPEMEIDPDKPKDYYIHRFQSFLKHRQVAKLLQIFAVMRTTIPYYFMLFLLTLAAYFVGIRLDNYVGWSWFTIFSPIWALDGMLLGVVIFILFYWSNRSPELEAATSQTFPWVTSGPISGVVISAIFAFYAAFVLLAAKLDDLPVVSNWSWWIITAPLIYISFLLTSSPILIMIKKGWIWSAFWAIFFVAAYDLTFYLTIAKLEGHINGDWCLIFLPWWISDIFSLVCVVSLCMELRSTKLGWCVAIIESAYMASIITLRSLLCVNLGTVCGDPVAYSFNLVFVSFHVLILIFALPCVVFIRHRFAIDKDAVRNRCC